MFLLQKEKDKKKKYILQINKNVTSSYSNSAINQESNTYCYISDQM